MTPAGAHQILIAGGGIGGLAAARGLAGVGLRVKVLERSSALGEIGAGIQLGPNAFHAFDALGVGDAVRRMAVYIDRLRLMDALSGEEITHLPLDAPFRERFGNPYAVVHRGDLHGVLLQACRDSPHIELAVRSEVASYEQDAASVTAVLSSGQRVTGAALIGADGLWSRVRQQVVGDGPPRVSGHTTYAGVARNDDVTHRFAEADTMAVPTHADVRIANGSAKRPLFLFMVDDAPLQRALGFYEEFGRAAG